MPIMLIIVIVTTAFLNSCIPETAGVAGYLLSEEGDKIQSPIKKE